MDMFLLFAVIFLCVMLGIGMGALALSLLFRLMVRMAGTAREARVAVAPVPSSQAPTA
jgi:hypothetical protein